jgi:NAD+ synthase (glutamine-hydrolysing)
LFSTSNFFFSSNFKIKNYFKILINRKILLIRPKKALADDGNYRERRYFTAWTKIKQIEDHFLPEFLQSITGQTFVPFGDGVIQSNDVAIGSEMCEEMWSPESTHIALALDGVEIISNSSGSHHELRKSNKRINIIRNATAKCGGVYLYANQRGCDGERLYYDGCAGIAINGQYLAQGGQFGLEEVEVLTAIVDIDEVHAYRNSMRSLQFQASQSSSYPRIRLPVYLSNKDESLILKCSPPIEWKFHSAMEEIA